MASTAEFEQLLEFIKSHRGFDFTGYKRASLERRFRKRMQALDIESDGEYLAYLEAHEDEFAELFNTILINVTSFFRDPPAWQYLREEIVPRLIEEARDRDSVRVWSTGCATGEEAYSLAMAFAEAMPAADFRERVKIYATDVDEEALSDGRHGAFRAARLEDVEEGLRERYFDAIDGGFVVKPELRRAVIFGRHDIVQDPPISRIDLLSSRNTLMYFTSAAQARIIANFHYALREDGLLFLGKSEMMLTRSPLFVPVDLKTRVFQKVGRSEGARLSPRLLERQEPTVTADERLRDIGFESAPVAQVLVDRAGTMVLANHQARLLFGLSPRDVGRPLKDLDLSYKPVELRSQIDRAYLERHAVSLHDVAWSPTGGDQRVHDVQITPLTASDGTFLGVSVSFVEVTESKHLQEEVERSKRDVETAYEELQSTVEELETTNEELQSTNEELETTNEELQSTNEELETMNEELQSTNEELETINDALNLRTDELDAANVFLESILRSVDGAMIVLDEELHVLAWNAAAEDLWGVRSGEVQAQHFMNLDIGFPVARLHDGLRQTLAGAPPEPVVLEATNRRGRSVVVTVRLAPLVGPTGAIRGAIVLMQAAAA